MTMQAFYVTSAYGMPMGCGYWRVCADTESEARDLAFKHCPDGRWSFMYPTLDAVHPLDRRLLGEITFEGLQLGLGIPEFDTRIREQESHND